MGDRRLAFQRSGRRPPNHQFPIPNHKWIFNHRSKIYNSPVMIAAFVDDLLFRSKLRAVAAHTGADVTFFRDACDPAIGEATLAIVDLDAPGATDAIAQLVETWPGLRIVGFVSHVRADRIKEARAAGATEIMARSAFVNALPTLLAC